MTDTSHINDTLEALSAQVLPADMRLMYVGIDDVKEQDLNAQSMPKAMFDQLVNNLKNSGAPESLPLLVKTDKGLEIVSGHHRIRAMRTAGIENTLAIVYTRLTPSQIRAKQLAHNSIHGTSDPDIVRRIWEQIDDVQARFEAFIDPAQFSDLKPVSFKPVDVDMVNVAKTVMVVFLPTQKVDFDAVIEAIMPKTQVDAVYIAHRAVYDEWKKAFQRVRADMDIVNAPTALAEMARLALERLDQLADEDGDGREETTR